jgi:hypothetical protein
MTAEEERDAAFAGARQAVQVHSDPDVGLDEIEVTPDDRPAPPPQAELAAALDARTEYLGHLRPVSALMAEAAREERAELRDRFAVALAPAVYDKLYVLSRGGPVTNDDFARELWGAAEASVKGRPPQ